jgi:hypothetical protein
MVHGKVQISKILVCLSSVRLPEARDWTFACLPQAGTLAFGIFLKTIFPIFF